MVLWDVLLQIKLVQIVLRGKGEKVEVMWRKLVRTFSTLVILEGGYRANVRKVKPV